QGWRLAEALGALKRAEGRVAGGAPADLALRVRKMRDDLNLVGRLEQIRLNAATLVDGHFDTASADRDYAALLLRERGLAAEGEDAGLVAARIQGSAIRAQLVAGLNDWAVATANRDRKVWLLEVARRADPNGREDPFYNPALWKNRALVGKLAKETRVSE